MAQELSQSALLRMASEHALTPLAERLAAMPPEMTHDLVALEAGLRRTMDGHAGPGASAAQYLLDAGGKRVRPLMCLLAARLFQPHGEVARLDELAGVAELIHGATLLHDDVIDLGELRRGRPAARLIYGNACAVLGGDLLLVQSVRTVGNSGVAELLDSLLDVLREMITAETLQLERRGRMDLRPEEYFEVVRGKTGALFRWSVEAGARAAGAPRPLVHVLQTFGYEVGESFQLTDDLLDLTQSPENTGKNVMADVEMGTITYPVILAIEHRPDLAERIPRVVAGESDDALVADLNEALHESGALGRARKQIAVRTERARAALSALPEGWARDTLRAFVDELAERSR